MAKDNLRYIDLKNYKVVDEPQGYIPCDKEIADVIAILNQKGYKTFASCAGHNRIDFTPICSCDISHLEQIKNDKSFRISKITENEILYRTEVLATSTHISFEKDYNFENIPIGFELKKSKNFARPVLCKMIYFYDENSTIRRSDDEIDKELNDGWKALYEWAKNLKDIKNI